MKRRTSFLLTAMCLCLTVSAWAHWPARADTNLLICNRTGEQTLPKIGATPDGGCYVCWYDHSSGNYDVYLQKLDSAGNVMWQTNGIPVDLHQQDTWLTDYDMTVDDSGYAIITVNDIRAGSDRDIFAYRVSPSGQMMWGTDGLTISSNDDFEPDPRVCVTSGGNIVFAWQEETPTSNVVNVRKVTAAGVDVWSPSVITLTSTYGLSIPRIVAAENDDVILQYIVARGTGLYPPKHIFAQKFDSSGATLWGDTGVVVSNASGLGPQMKPDLVADDSGGVYSYWYDSHDANHLYAYVQHVRWDGTMAWTANGVRASMAAGQLQMSPALCKTLGGVMMFYQASNSDQSQWGVGGQMIDYSGARVWGDNAITFAGLNTQQRFNIWAVTADTGATVVYSEFTSGSAVNTLVKAIRVNTSGSMVWNNSPQTLCSVVSAKGRLAVTVNRIGQTIVTWPDQRSDPSGDMYVQNVNPDGTLGDYGPPPPPPPTMMITSPQNGAEVDSLPLVVEFMVENFAVMDSGGDGVIAVSVNGTTIEWHSNTQPISIAQLAEGSNTIILELVNYQYQSLQPRVADTVAVIYSPPNSASDDAVIPDRFALLAAYPNPFNPVTTIGFTVPRASKVSLKVFDVLGREVRAMQSAPTGTLQPGTYHVEFDGSNLATGIYFVRMTTGDFVMQRKIVLLK